MRQRTPSTVKAPQQPAVVTHTASRVTLSVGGMTCSSCSNAISSALHEIPGVSDVVINVLGSSAILKVASPEITPTVLSTIEDIGYTAELVSVEALVPPHAQKPSAPTVSSDGPMHVEMSVGGMTCASCVNTVTGILSEIPGVSDVAVSLIGKSATAVVQNRDMVPQLEEAINDAGYEGEVVVLRPLDPGPAQDEAVGPRSISIRVDGMFCS